MLKIILKSVILFVTLGPIIAFFIFGLSDISDKRLKYIETSAIVTDVYREGHKRVHHDFSYDVEGETYSGYFIQKTQGADVGDSVSIYYDPGDPAVFVNNEDLDYLWHVLKTFFAVLIVGILDVYAINAVSKEISK